MTRSITVASTNPVKIRAAHNGFNRMFPGETFTAGGVSVASGVPDQPKTSQETLLGAMNRAQAAAEIQPGSFAVGIEGGVEDTPLGLMAFAWVVVIHGEQTGRSMTGSFFLPDEVARLVRQGTELGEADDIVFGRQNSKQQNGSLGLLTADALDRTEFYEQAVMMALLPFKNPGLTWGEESL